MKKSLKKLLTCLAFLSLVGCASGKVSGDPSVTTSSVSDPTVSESASETPSVNPSTNESVPSVPSVPSAPSAEDSQSVGGTSTSEVPSVSTSASDSTTTPPVATDWRTVDKLIMARTLQGEVLPFYPFAEDATVTADTTAQGIDYVEVTVTSSTDYTAAYEALLESAGFEKVEFANGTYGYEKEINEDYVLRVICYYEDGAFGILAYAVEQLHAITDWTADEKAIFNSVLHGEIPVFPVYAEIGGETGYDVEVVTFNEGKENEMTGVIVYDYLYADEDRLGIYEDLFKVAGWKQFLNREVSVENAMLNDGSTIEVTYTESGFYIQTNGYQIQAYVNLLQYENVSYIFVQLITFELEQTILAYTASGWTAESIDYMNQVIGTTIPLPTFPVDAENEVVLQSNAVLFIVYGEQSLVTDLHQFLTANGFNYDGSTESGYNYYSQADSDVCAQTYYNAQYGALLFWVYLDEETEEPVTVTAYENGDWTDDAKALMVASIGRVLPFVSDLDADAENTLTCSLGSDDVHYEIQLEVAGADYSAQFLTALEDGGYTLYQTSNGITYLFMDLNTDGSRYVWIYLYYDEASTTFVLHARVVYPTNEVYTDEGWTEDVAADMMGVLGFALPFGGLPEADDTAAYNLGVGPDDAGIDNVWIQVASSADIISSYGAVLANEGWSLDAETEDEAFYSCSVGMAKTAYIQLSYNDRYGTFITARVETNDTGLFGNDMPTAYDKDEPKVYDVYGYTYTLYYAATFDNGTTIQLKNGTGYIEADNIGVLSSITITVTTGSVTVEGKTADGEWETVEIGEDGSYDMTGYTSFRISSTKGSVTNIESISIQFVHGYNGIGGDDPEEELSWLDVSYAIESTYGITLPWADEFAYATSFELDTWGSETSVYIACDDATESFVAALIEDGYTASSYTHPYTGEEVTRYYKTTDGENCVVIEIEYYEFDVYKTFHITVYTSTLSELNGTIDPGEQGPSWTDDQKLTLNNELGTTIPYIEEFDAVDPNYVWVEGSGGGLVYVYIAMDDVTEAYEDALVAAGYYYYYSVLDEDGNVVDIYALSHPTQDNTAVFVQVGYDEKQGELFIIALTNYFWDATTLNYVANGYTITPFYPGFAQEGDFETYPNANGTQIWMDTSLGDLTEEYTEFVTALGYRPWYRYDSNGKYLGVIYFKVLGYGSDGKAICTFIEFEYNTTYYQFCVYQYSSLYYAPEDPGVPPTESDDTYEAAKAAIDDLYGY